MAQIDASIPLGVRPFQMPDQVNSLAKVLQLQGMQNEQQLGQMKMQEYQQGVQRKTRLQDLLAKPYDTPDARENALLTGGFIDEASKLGKDRRENLKLDAGIKKDTKDAEKIDFDMEIKRIEHVSSVLSTARDPASYDAARQVLARQFGDKVLANLPPQFDPNALQATIAQGQTLTQRLNDERQRQQQAEAARHNRSTEGLTAQGQQITMRGQNMTDSRAREFNAVAQDANTVKREERKATADLTKNSQIASFDTMLGTLDRLGAHPGLKRSVGVVGALPTMPGSDSANFQAELNTFQSQAFLPMVAQLKGMGALSDAEGKKLTAAVGALDPRMGEAAFRESVTRITEDMEQARERMAGQRRTPVKNGATGKVGNALPAGGVIDFGSLK